MKCPECFGTSFERGHFDVAQVVERQPVLIRNVPGSACSQCGYLVVSARQAKAIERTLRHRLPNTVVATEVYDLAMPLTARQVVGTPILQYAVASSRIG